VNGGGTHGGEMMLVVVVIVIVIMVVMMVVVPVRCDKARSSRRGEEQKEQRGKDRGSRHRLRVVESSVLKPDREAERTQIKGHKPVRFFRYTSKDTHGLTEAIRVAAPDGEFRKTFCTVSILIEHN
jgi:hypothetical protein